MTSTTELEPAALQYELVSPPKPKPSVKALRESHARFYGALARGFDEFNLKSTRGLYLKAIDTVIARKLVDMGVSGKLLSVGAGTGFREERIRELTRTTLKITCIDICPEMCKEASNRNLDVICSTLFDANLEPGTFDACIFLNAFESLANHDERVDYFVKINQALKPGAPFFVDAMDINDQNDSWAALVKKQFADEKLHDHGYDLGDCFSRRTDQEQIVFAHYSSKAEMEELFARSSFEVSDLQYFSEETGGQCLPNQGNMFYVARKK